MTDKKPEGGDPTWATGDVIVGSGNYDIATPGGRLRKSVSEAGGNAVVAKKAGISTTTLHSYLNGSEMKLGTTVRLAEVCGVSPSWLAFGDLDRPPEHSATTSHQPLNHAFMLTAVKALDLALRIRGAVGQDEQAELLVEWYGRAEQFATSTADVGGLSASILDGIVPKSADD